MLKVSRVCRNIITVLYCCNMDLFFPLDLGLYKCIEFRVYGAISSAVCPSRINVVLPVGPSPPPPPPDLRLHTRIEFRVQGTISYVVCQKMITAVLLYCGSVFPPDLGLYKCIVESRVHGTISSVVCQNMITAVLWIYPRYMPVQAYRVKGTRCPYEYVGCSDLPAVTVQRFWTNHVETCVGVITPNSWRQMLCSHFLSPFSLFLTSFNKRVK